MPEPEITPTNPEPVATPEPAPEPIFNAKESFEKLERMLYTVAGQLQNIQQPAAAPVKEPEEMRDEELWSLAQQGNRQAFEMYQQRIADRQFDKRFGAVQQNQGVQQQIAYLVKEYPEFTDPNHALTQRARAFKQVQVQMGESPNSLQTDLNAMLRAVADSRAIIAPKAPTMPARSASASGHLAPSHQQVPSPTTPAEKVSPDEAALAKRMGIKDASKAKQRFNERQANGLSSVSPTIIAALDVMDRQGNVR